MDAEPTFVIVRRGHFATFELLTRTFAGDPSIQIIWDRRIAERRRASDGAADAGRRRVDRRRVPPTQWGQINYMFAGSEGAGASS